MLSNVAIRRQNKPLLQEQPWFTPLVASVQPGAGMDTPSRLEEVEHSVCRCVGSVTQYLLTYSVVSCLALFWAQGCKQTWILCPWEQSVSLLMQGLCMWEVKGLFCYSKLSSDTWLSSNQLFSYNYQIDNCECGHYCPSVLASQSTTLGYEVPTHIRFL